MNKKLFEVRIRYTGVSAYFVDADSAEEAEKSARALYESGHTGHFTGAEWEEIESADTEQIDPKHEVA